MFCLLLILSLQLCSQQVVSESHVVEFLPGFEGSLPFYFETGYVGVDEREEVQLFYYFAKSESNPKEDPLLLWLTGGPGCSVLSGLIYEIGPVMFKDAQYNGNLPSLVLNPNSWTKSASILFVDLPVGTGFSYAKTASAARSTQLQACEQAYEFMRKWLKKHPDFISNPFYIGGDSYSGLTVPILMQLISNGNEVDTEQVINLKGYLLGNPTTTPDADNYRIEFAHGMGLIPDELYESLQINCKGEYRQQFINPSNALCLQDVEAYTQCLNGLNEAHILENSCPYAAPRPIEIHGERRALDERLIEHRTPSQIRSATRCRIDGYRLSYIWADDTSVREALHIRKGSLGKWQRCNSYLPYTTTIFDARPYHLNLSKLGYRSLIYSGDHDMLVPRQSTQAWIKDLKYPIIDQWRSWRVNGQIAGYTRTFSNNMTFATIKGGGHTAPEYKPEESYAMFKRWISYETL